jgi:hypothetical protein
MMIRGRRVMPDETDEIVRLIGQELVSRLAPEELPLYPSLVSQFEGTNGGRGRKSSDDQILGFGVGEVVVLLTPVILSFARAFWQALLEETADTALHGVLERFQAHRAGHPHVPMNPPRFTEEQIQLVRSVAMREADRLKNISKGQAGLLADAMAGVLAAPPVS